MSQFSAWLPSRRQLQQHLARLVDTLEALVQRLRESIARTVGEAVANAVHEITHRLSPAAAERPGAVRLATSANRGTTGMNPNGTTDRLMPRTATGTTMCREFRPRRPPRAGVMPWPWAARPRPGGWPGKSAAIRSSFRPAWA